MSETGFQFGTRAETLERLAGCLSRASIPAFLHFTSREWQQDRAAVLSAIDARQWKHDLIIRSSAMDEDGEEAAGAGQYDSIAGVDPKDRDSIVSGVEQVLHSYRQVRGCDHADDRILVQDLICNVMMSGVLFTQDLNTGSPYFVINYDDETGRTDTVTAGTEYSNRTLYVHRGAVNAVRSERFRTLLAAIEELEQVTRSQTL